MKTFLFSVGLLATTTAVSAQSYICTMRSIGEGFVVDAIGLKLNDDGKSGVVYDGLINRQYGKPIQTAVKKNARGEHEFSWRVRVPANPQEVQVNYRAFLDTAKKTVRIRGRIKGYTNRVTGTGQCQLSQF